MDVTIFNPFGNDSDRQIIGGQTTNLIELNNIRYQWAIQLYEQMRGYFWIPEKLDITGDIISYQKLTPNEQRAFDGILSYLTFLDSIQVQNLPIISQYITAPEISICLAEQVSQEAMHNKSYQWIIETVIPKEKRNKIYNFWREDAVLFKRCKNIAQYYENFVAVNTPTNFFHSIFANYLLEGIYFYNGFIFFYNLASRMLMPGCADIFKMINRDELNHVRLFQKIIKELFNRDDIEINNEELYEMTKNAVNHEIKWSKHIIGNQILGITEESTEQYTKHLANIRLKAIGLKPIYHENPENPYKHLEKIADLTSEAETKSNFFESTVTSYVQSSSVGGWDF